MNKVTVFIIHFVTIIVVMYHISSCYENMCESENRNENVRPISYFLFHRKDTPVCSYAYIILRVVLQCIFVQDLY